MLKTVLWVFFWTEASLLGLQTAFSWLNEAPLCVLMRGDGNRAHVWVLSMDISVLSLFGSSWDVPALLRDIYSGDVLLIGVWAEPRGGDVTRWVWRKGWAWITCLKRFNVNWRVGMRKSARGGFRGWCVASRWKCKISVHERQEEVGCWNKTELFLFCILVHWCALRFVLWLLTAYLNVDLGSFCLIARNDYTFCFFLLSSVCSLRISMWIYIK